MNISFAILSKEIIAASFYLYNLNLDYFYTINLFYAKTV